MKTLGRAFTGVIGLCALVALIWVDASENAVAIILSTLVGLVRLIGRLF